MSVFAQQSSFSKGDASERCLPEEAESPPAKQEVFYREEQDVTPRAPVGEYLETPVSAAAAEADTTPGPSDKAAANLSKALKKLQVESAVLQEHSRRLQEKAAVIQQQRASADQVHVVYRNTTCCDFRSLKAIVSCIGSSLFLASTCSCQDSCMLVTALLEFGLCR